jgi:hypothetical protein
MTNVQIDGDDCDTAWQLRTRTIGTELDIRSGHFYLTHRRDISNWIRQRMVTNPGHLLPANGIGIRSGLDVSRQLKKLGDYLRR